MPKKCIHNVILLDSFQVYNLLSWVLKCLWRQDSSLVAVVDSAESGGTGLESRCGRNLFLVHIYAGTQTVQIRGIIMPTELITDPPIKNVHKINSD